jgi:hypothetical protein
VSGQKNEKAKSAKLEVRMASEDLAILDRAAAQKGVDRSVFVREVLRDAAQGAGISVSPEVMNVLRALQELTGDSLQLILNELLFGVGICGFVNDQLEDYLALKGIDKGKYEAALAGLKQP